MAAFDSLRIAGSGLSMHQTWLDTLSYNIANANTVRSTAEITGGATVAFRQEIWREAPAPELLVSADVRVACVDAAGFRPRRIPDSIRKEVA